jgi:HEAT repeat protein
MRAEEERYIAFAAAQADTLRTVLRSSSHAEHRALAAEILAYGTDRAAIARDLLAAVDDPDGDVRNNAVRALAVLAEWAVRNPEAGIRIPADPFIALLSSVEWTDRNKGAFALMSLTEPRDAALLAELRARAYPSLAEMARWTNPGHAMMSYMILARIAGVSDREAFEAFNGGRREAVIAAAAPGAR